MKWRICSCSVPPVTARKGTKRWKNGRLRIDRLSGAVTTYVGRPRGVLEGSVGLFRLVVLPPAVAFAPSVLGNLSRPLRYDGRPGGPLRVRHGIENTERSAGAVRGVGVRGPGYGALLLRNGTRRGTGNPLRVDREWKAPDRVMVQRGEPRNPRRPTPRVAWSCRVRKGPKTCPWVTCVNCVNPAQEGKVHCEWCAKRIAERKESK